MSTQDQKSTPHPQPELLPEVFVETAEQFKSVAHPLRLAILRLLIQKPHTNSELAHTMGIDSGNSHFHLKNLLSVGFVRLVGTRQNKAITEKLYRATAVFYRVKSPISPDHKAPSWGGLQIGMDLLKNTEMFSPELFDDLYLARHNTISLTSEKAAWLVSAFNELILEAQRCNVEEPGPEHLAVTALVHRLPAINGQPKNSQDDGGISATSDDAGEKENEAK